MTIPQSFNCPNCKAPLQLPAAHVPAVTCTYCGSTVIVPAEFSRSAENTSPQPADFDSIINFTAGASEILVRVTELAGAGDKDDAVQLFQDTFDVSHEAAVQAVDRLAAGEAVSLPSLSVRTSSTRDPSAPTINLSKYRRPIVACGVLALFLIIAVSIFAPLALTALIPWQIKTIFENVESISLGTIEPGETFNLNPPLNVLSVTPTPGLLSQILAFGSQGTGPGELNDPREIAVDAEGNIFIADHEAGRVQRFNSQGQYLNGWMTSAGDYTFGMDTGQDGALYSIVQGDLYFYRGDTGELVRMVEPDPFFTFEDVAVAADGSLVLVADDDTLVWMDRSGNILRSVENVISKVESSGELAARIALDASGNVYLLGRFTNSVFVYSPLGEFLTRFGSEGNEPGQLRAPFAISTDNQENIYVSDIKGIQVFDSTGHYLALINPPQVTFGLDFNDRNELFVITNLPQAIQYRINWP